MALQTGAKTSPRGTSAVEFSHMFTEGDGGEMIDALLDGFAKSSPGHDVTEAQISDHYELLIKSRFLMEEAPDVFFGWLGNALKPYVDAGVVMDITEIWESNGLQRGYVDTLVDLSTFDGQLRCIPVTLHRINNIFYNVAIAEERGVDPRKIDDVWDFLEVVKQAHCEGVAGFGMPMKNPWTVTMIWGELVLGHLGPEAFEEIIRGNPRPYESSIEETFEILDQLAEFGFDEPSFVDMGGANERFMQDEALFFHQGDWVAGAYGQRDGFDYQRDWDHIPFPGSDGTYVMSVDTMIGSDQATNRDGARALLEYAASPEALRAMNRIKGSIPPRRDVSIDDYPLFLQDQYQDYKQTRHHVPAVKAMISPDAGVEEMVVTTSFINNRDVQQATREMIEGLQH